MHRVVIAAFALALASLPVKAQEQVSEGERLRVLLDDGDIWLFARGLAPRGDSSALLLQRSTLELRFVANGLRVQRPQGRDHAAGMALGAAVGSMLLVFPAVAAPGSANTVSTVILPAAVIGGLFGGFLGYALAPKGWGQIGNARSSCGNWRLVAGSQVVIWNDGTRHQGTVLRHDDASITLRPSADRGEDIRLPTLGSRLDLSAIRRSAGVALACP